MAIESPLFQSAMELIGHSISHYNGKKELDRKLVILHLANAVELILKDLVLDQGISIYKNPKETITIHNCIGELGKTSIELPFLNKIELLIDERNALQHRFGSPNELTTIFYMKIAEQFFSEILKEYYGQDYDEIISQYTEDKDLQNYKLTAPTNNKELEKLSNLAKIHPLGALLSAWTYLESTTSDFETEIGLTFRRRPFLMYLSRGGMHDLGISLPEDLREKFSSIRFIRNQAAHGRVEPTKKQVDEAIKIIEAIETFLKSLDLDPVKEKVLILKQEYENEREAYKKAKEEHRKAQLLFDIDKETD